MRYIVSGVMSHLSGEGPGMRKPTIKQQPTDTTTTYPPKNIHMHTHLTCDFREVIIWSKMRPVAQSLALPIFQYKTALIVSTPFESGGHWGGHFVFGYHADRTTQNKQWTGDRETIRNLFQHWTMLRIRLQSAHAWLLYFCLILSPLITARLERSTIIIIRRQHSNQSHWKCVIKNLLTCWTHTWNISRWLCHCCNPFFFCFLFLPPSSASERQQVWLGPSVICQSLRGDQHWGGGSSSAWCRQWKDLCSTLCLSVSEIGRDGGGSKCAPQSS